MAAPVTAGAMAILKGLLLGRGLRPSPDQIENLVLLGAKKDPALVNRVRLGAVLSLPDLVARVDRDTGIVTGSLIPRAQAKGTFNFIRQPASINLAQGEAATLSFGLSEDSTQAPNIQWYKNEVPIPGATASDLRLNSKTEKIEGTYKVELKVGASSATSSSAVVRVCP